MERYCSMKDIACDIEDIADATGTEYDVLVDIVEFMVKVMHLSYEDAVDRVRP